MLEISSHIRNLVLTDPDAAKLQKSDFFDIKDTKSMHKNAEWFEHQGDLIYIPGYLSIKYNGKELLGVEYWDYIYWLWISFSRKRDKKIKEDTRFSFDYPDQPLNVDFIGTEKDSYLMKIIGNEQLIREYLIKDDLLVDKILEAGISFFEAISQYSNTESIKERIDQLRSQY